MNSKSHGENSIVNVLSYKSLSLRDIIQDIQEIHLLFSSLSLQNPASSMATSEKGDGINGQNMDCSHDNVESEIKKKARLTEGNHAMQALPTPNSSPPPTTLPLSQPRILDLSIAAPPSMLPPKKYCDLTGLLAPYTDPKTGLRFHSSLQYRAIQGMPPEVLAHHRALRGTLPSPTLNA